MTKSYKKRLIICFMGILLTLCFHHFVSKKMEFVTYSNGNLEIQDYAYHIIIVKKFWFDGFGNIYKLAFQQQALSAHFGSQVYTVMPLGITPIALVVWLPFAYAARFSIALSYTLWITFSLGILITAFWNIVPNFYRNKNLPILPVVLSLITLFSAATFRALQLGQTSVLAAGLLIYLFCFAHRSKFGNLLIVSLLIFILGIKPPYIALGLGLLIIYGMWKETLYSITIVLVFILGITPLLTIEWIPTYFYLLQIHCSGTIPGFYAWSINPETMNIFRSAFRNIIGDNISSIISNVVIYSVYIGIVGPTILTRIRGKTTCKLTSLKLTKGQLFVLLVASYLLFAPYAGAYEDVLFLPVFFTVLKVGNTPNLTNYKSLALIFALFAILLQSYFPPDKPLWLFWILKAFILWNAVNFCRYIPQGKDGIL